MGANRQGETEARGVDRSSSVAVVKKALKVSQGLETDGVS